MNLKESYRYQNKLQNLLSETQYYLNITSNVTQTTQEHFRKKSNPNAEDENINISRDRLIDHPINVIGDFAMHLIELKEQLSKAITKAKLTASFDIDAAISNNKLKQSLASTFKSMCNIKSSERVTQGTGYIFNAEGNQVPYRYEVKEVQTIDFDRNKFKAMEKKLMRQADEKSTELDKIQIDTIVEFETLYDVNDSFEDILDQFVNSQN